MNHSRTLPSSPYISGEGEVHDGHIFSSEKISVELCILNCSAASAFMMSVCPAKHSSAKNSAKGKDTMSFFSTGYPLLVVWSDIRLEPASVDGDCPPAGTSEYGGRDDVTDGPGVLGGLSFKIIMSDPTSLSAIDTRVDRVGAAWVTLGCRCLDALKSCSGPA